MHPLFSLLAFFPALAASVGQSNHGAGGPFVRLGAWSALQAEAGPFLDLTAGGFGYSYHADGHLRLGGGGQGTNGSWSLDGDPDLTGHVGWGGLLVAWDPLSSPRWELPVGVCVGGGSWSVDRVVQDGTPALVESRGHSMMVAQGFLAAERRLARTLKATFQADLVVGLNQGVAVRSGGLSFQTTFLIPREGH